MPPAGAAQFYTFISGIDGCYFSSEFAKMMQDATSAPGNGEKTPRFEDGVRYRPA
jgi:hypothetical protein